MKFVIFQGVNGSLATLEGLLEVEADAHLCLGNVIAFDLRDHRNLEGSLRCLDLVRKQMQICDTNGRAFRLLRGYNEEVYLNLHKKSSGHPADHKLGDENLAFIRSFYLRLQRNQGSVVFLPWIEETSGIEVNDPAGLSRKTDNERRLHLLTDDDVAHHYGRSMKRIIGGLFPKYGDYFVHFIGKWRLATLWEMRVGSAVPKVIPPEKYGEKGSLRSTTCVLDEDRETVVFPGSAELGYYCTYDTDSRELAIVHDSNLTY